MPAPNLGWKSPYYCEWGKVVGDRVRRLRRAHGLTLVQFTDRVWKPEAGRYSQGYFSRLERGFANAPLYVYLSVAAALGIEPGVLLGPDEAGRTVSTREMTLIRLMRRLEIEPEDLLELLARGLPAAGTTDEDAPPLDAPGALPSEGPGRATPAAEQVPTWPRDGASAHA
jgi:transcriptional regulator with XRE-family HTH domain